MKRQAPKFDMYLLKSSTERAQDFVIRTLDAAHRLGADTDKEARLKRHFCAACHYPSRLAGQAFTDQPCACCGTPQTYSSTATDVLCMDCAKKHELCKHCGGDLEMRTGRRKWPEEARK